MEDDAWGYLINVKSDKRATPAFELFTSLDDALAWCRGVRKKDSKEEGEPAPEARDFAPEDIKFLQNKFIENISSYKSLISMIGSVRSALYGAAVRREITDRGEREFKTVEIVQGYKVRAILHSQVREFDRALERVLEVGRGLSVLPGSNLLSLVATFDSFIADIAFRSFRARPDLFSDDTQVPLKMVLNSDGKDDLLDNLARARVDDCMRGSHTSQVEFLEKIANTEIIKHFERWADFVEIFERRNLVAHNSLIVNSIYLANTADAGCDTSGLNIGSNLELDSYYLMSSVDVLLEFGILLLYSIWRKRYKNSSVQAYENLNEIAYDLIRKRNPKVASRILHFALNKQKRIGEDAIAKRMTVNLANCYKKMNDNDKLNATLNSMDWSSSSDVFKVSIAALNEDVEKVVALMPRVAGKDEVGSFGFREWPVFDAVRDDERYIKSFEDTFKSPLRSPVYEQDRVAEVTRADDKNLGSPKSESEETVH